MQLQPFSKALRLLKSSEFQAVFDKVDRKFFAEGFLVLVRRSILERARIGLVVGKKALPLAVKRNLFKRLVRESFRINQQSMQGLDIVVIARRELAQQNRHEMWQNLNKLWRNIVVAQNRF